MPGLRMLILLIAVAVVGGACGDDTTGSAAPRDPAQVVSQRLEEASTGTVPPVGDEGSTTTTLGQIDPTTIAGAVVNQYSLGVGDCFNRLEELREGRATVITARVDCSEPHDMQVFDLLSYPAPHPSVYPGDEPMRQFALESCYRSFEDWVGRPYEESDLEIEVLTPDQENFEDDAARYRGIHCWLRRVDFEPLVGDARGSGL